MENRSNRPGFLAEEAERIAAESFSVSGKAGELPGYNDQNFLITDDSGRRYVLKIANRETSVDSLKIQNRVLEGIVDNREGIGCPRFYRALSL
jgi:Ser/Thr protein kinase RdoA (MazF antagonist)